MAAVPVQAQNAVTFEDIVAAPDDLALNLAYAQEQAEQGDLEQAAATVERLLFLRPDWDEARLFYAGILHRLADYEGAERELRLLEERPLTPLQRHAARRLLEVAASRSKVDRVTASVSVGLAYDSNPAFISSSGGPAGTDEHHPDLGKLVLGDIRYEHELDSGRGDLLFVDAVGSARWYLEEGRGDNAQGRARAGGTFYAGDIAITPYGYVEATALTGRPWRRELGGGLDLRAPVTASLDVVLSARLGDQHHHDLRLDPLASFRDGTFGTLGAGIEANPLPVLSYALRAGVEHKQARLDGLSWQGVGVSGYAQFALGAGQAVRASFGWLRRDFGGPDPLLRNGIDRQDDRFEGRLAYIVPLPVLADRIGLDALAVPDLDLEIGVSGLTVESTDPNFDGHRLSGDILLTHRVSF